MIGLGAIGQRHLRNLQQLLGEELEVIAWRTRRLNHVLTPQMQIEENADVESRFNISVFAELADALAQNPDIAVIANPTHAHIPVAIEAARAGCHLFLEKPLSHNLDGIQELQEIVREKNLVAFVGYQLRFHPCYKLVRTLLQQNAIGNLLTARMAFGEYLPGWHPYEDYRQSYAARRELGGGVILTQIHDLDIALWLFGMPRRVFALGGHFSDLELDVEDTVSMLLECEYSHREPYRQTLRALPVHVQQDYLQKPGTRSLEIVGDTGKIALDLPLAQVEVFHADCERAEIHCFENFERNQIFMEEIQHFLECIKTNTTPSITIVDGAQSLKIALAALRSLETGNPETV
jgi:predicted dehydrogenase